MKYFDSFLAFTLLLAGCQGSTPAGETVVLAGESGVETVSSVPLNANLATEADLSGQAVIGAELAAAIVSGRPYLNMSDLHAVVGPEVDENALEGVYAAVFVTLNLNAASRDQILMVPGVGDRMAHEFEDYRPYVAMAQFRREMSKYVDDAEVERLAGFVFVPIDLNTASDEEILAIPGVGSRMLHEFQEYRPYAGMAQFHREIGKYVDDAELARLARFVEIR